MVGGINAVSKPVYFQAKQFFDVLPHCEPYPDGFNDEQRAAQNAGQLADEVLLSVTSGSNITIAHLEDLSTAMDGCDLDVVGNLQCYRSRFDHVKT
jgi:hypothetical protein